MLAAKRPVGITPEVNLRNPLHTVNKAGKWGIYPGFEIQARCHQKSKNRVSVVTQIGQKL